MPEPVNGDMLTKLGNGSMPLVAVFFVLQSMGIIGGQGGQLHVPVPPEMQSIVQDVSKLSETVAEVRVAITEMKKLPGTLDSINTTNREVMAAIDRFTKVAEAQTRTLDAFVRELEFHRRRVAP